MKSIFVVTTLEYKRGLSYHSDSRTVGWFDNEIDARNEVEGNSLDIHEGNFNYCVIEKTETGIYPVPPLKEIWYYWNKEKERYVRIRKPKKLKSIVNFGIG